LKVLVLGSAGYIGKNFTNHLLINKYEVIQFDIHDGRKFDLRISENQALRKSISQADFIFFFAFDVGNANYINKNDANYNFIQNNSKILINTFEVISNFDKPFVFISSQMASNNNSSYGLLKKLGEKLTSSLGGVNCRLWNIFGGIFPDPNNHVIYDIISGAQNGKISLLTNGEERRQFLRMEDLCSILEGIIKNYPSLTKFEFVDVTSHYWIKIKELAFMISEIYNQIPVELSDQIASINSDTQPNSYLNHSMIYNFELLKKYIIQWSKKD
jgi:nucleoside-diphosphate-sugar epimerase